MSEQTSGGAGEAGRPHVSVIIAAYNAAEYIGETLASVFAQTFSGYEVLVVNDGSEDAEELARALAPYRGRIIYLEQENQGLAAARNTGLRAARGHYAAFLDADDLWEPDYLKEQFEFIVAGSHDLVYTDALLFGDSALAGRRFMEVAPSAGEVTFESLMRGECNVIGSGVFARKAALFDAGLFDTGLRNAQDFDLWIRMVLRGCRLAYQRKVLVRYRYREGSLSGDAVNRVRRELRVYGKIRDQYELSPAQRAEVVAAIRRMEGELNLVEGKEHLARGDFARARESLARADSLRPGWRLKGARLLLRLSPRLLLRLARGRLRTEP
ncbi:MAG: glycosyltransferase family 2 protein [Pyrinomonadaceae bacterium]